MNTKNIAIDSAKRIAKIDNCKVIVSIEIKIFHDIAMQKSMHLRKIMIISSRFEQTIEIHYLTVSVNRDYFFESAKLNYLTIYVYMIDIIIKIVMIRNKFDTTIQIS